MLHEREKAVLETLAKIPKRHVVLVGGYAVNVYVPPRFSIDCDLVVLDGLAKLEAALVKEGFARTEKGNVPYGSYVRYEKEEDGVAFDLRVNAVLDRDSRVTFDANLFERHSKKRTTVGKVNPSRIELRVVVIADNASFHHAAFHKDWRTDHARRFALDHLPPYSPELNPVERVWKLTRRLATHNRYFKNLNAVVESVEPTFDAWARGNETLRRLCAII